MKTRLTILIVLALPLLSSCLSRERAKEMFVESRDFDVGRKVTEVPLGNPSSIAPIDEHTSLYIYEFQNTGCKWSYVVDNNTKRVLSWKFISDPDLCYLRMRGGG